MTMRPDDRRARIDAICEAAMDRTPRERVAFVAAACGADAELRLEVDALLAHTETAAAFLSRPIAALAADAFGGVSNDRQSATMGRDLIGRRLGVYEIHSWLGAGGMGEVFRARDTTLGRDVAIKILPRHFTSNADRLARFEREARLLATLNHPHIGAIYGTIDVDAVRGLILEFVDGPTLADRLAAGPLPLDDAIAGARQIAEALEAAHEKGIVHRDLKPSNIKLSSDGAIKVIDFGLAKAGGVDGSDYPAAPARTQHATESGLIVGSAAYMSPEQARGRRVDKRTDIWAFGCVFYEMLTGTCAFAADTPSDSIARVLAHDPDWTALPADIPGPIRRLIERCLEKDPADRLHDAADARIELADAAPGRSRRAHTIATADRRGLTPLAALIVGLLVAGATAIGVVGWWQSRSQPSPSADPLEFGVTFPNNFTVADGAAISPDGRTLAANVWSNSGDIWLSAFDGSAPKPLAGAENAAFPFWSPDSTRLGFIQSSQIVTMNPRGGPITQVAALTPFGDASGATWGRDNVIAFSTEAGLFRVAASGGQPPVELPISGRTGVPRGPTFLPDGRHILFCDDGATGGSMSVASIEGGPAKHLGASLCPGGFAKPNYVLFVRGGSLLAQRLDLQRLTLEGDPQLVASGVNRGAAGPWPRLTVSASDTGVLVLPAPRGGSSLGQLTWFNRAGQVVGVIKNRARDQAENLNAEISPTTDNLVAVNRLDVQTGTWHIWLIDGSRDDAESRLTADSASDVDPIWSSDGKEILFTSDRGGTLAFYRQSIDGGIPSPALDVSGLTNPIPSDWPRPGFVLFQQLQQSIWMLRPGERTPTRLAEREPHAYGAHLSPDGEWLAYSAAPQATFELFVERFPGGAPRKQVSIGGGVHPRWTKGGKELVYWAPPGGIVANDLVLGPDGIVVGPPRTLVSQPVLTLIDARTHFDVTRDGQKILMRQPGGPPTPGIRVLVNWAARLR